MHFETSMSFATFRASRTFGGEVVEADRFVTSSDSSAMVGLLS
jgi:hypothetical protein